MRRKWHFRNEPSKDFSEIAAFRPKSTWKPPAGDPCVELFLRKMEHEYRGNHKVITLLRRNGEAEVKN